MSWDDVQALMKAGDTVVVAHEDGPVVVMPLWRYRALLEAGETSAGFGQVASEPVAAPVLPPTALERPAAQSVVRAPQPQANPKSEHPVYRQNVGDMPEIIPPTSSAAAIEEEVTTYEAGEDEGVYSPLPASSPAPVARPVVVPPRPEQDVESLPEYDQEAVEAAISAAQARFSSNFQGNQRPEAQTLGTKKKTLRGEEAFYLR